MPLAPSIATRPLVAARSSSCFIQADYLFTRLQCDFGPGNAAEAGLRVVNTTNPVVEISYTGGQYPTDAEMDRALTTFRDAGVNVIIGCTTGCSNETEKTWPSQSRPCYSNWKPKNNYDLSPSLCSYWGCQDSTRANYVPSATIPLTCRGFVPYCKDPTAFNYWDCLHLYPVFNSATSTLTFIKQYDVRTTYWAARKEKYGYEATMHDQSMCVVLGCMDTTSVYYNSKATFSPAALRTARRPPAATMAADCPLATAECTLPIVHCRLRRRPVTFSKTQPTTHAIKSMVSMCLAIPYPK